MEIREAKKQVINAGKALVENGLIARTWGNVSCRLDDNSFVISASGRNYMTLTEDEVIRIDMDTLEYEGDIKPSSEKKMHREIYQLKENAGFIIHTHQHNASAVSAMRKKVIPLDKEYEGIGDFIICAEYRLPSTTKVADKVAEAVNDSIGQAVLMANHGAVVYGKSYDEAFAIVNALEDACGKYLEYLGIDPWDGNEEKYRELWNNDPVIMKYIEHKNSLLPYLDDFAQMVGPSLEIIDYDESTIAKAKEDGKPLLVRGHGAMCNAANEDDQVALSMLIEKNCRAALAGLGCAPIGRYEAIFMRQFYLQKYSRLKNASEDSGK